MSSLDPTTIRTIADGLRDLASNLEALLDNGNATNPTPPGLVIDGTGNAWTGGVFDPDTDVPPVTPTPNRAADPVGADWCGLMLFAGLYSLTARQGRRATRDEARRIAHAAGYRDLRAWSGWTTGGHDPVVDTNDHGEMKILPRGIDFLRSYLGKVGAELPTDLADLTLPKVD